MRDTDFEEALLLFQGAIHRSVTKIKNPSTAQIVVSGLASKCLSHCGMAIELTIAGATPEAIILLRAAYEAVIRGTYLDENPSEIAEYVAFSAITSLRNQLELLSILNDSGEPFDDKHLQEQLAEKQKSKIINERYHVVLKLKESDLDNLIKLKKATNKSNLPSFESIRRNIAKTPINTALLSTGFGVYNLGSQMAHSNYEMVTAMVYFQENHPLYTERTVYQQALLLLLSVCKCFESSGVITKEAFKSLQQQSQYVSAKHLMAYRVN